MKIFRDIAIFILILVITFFAVNSFKKQQKPELSQTETVSVYFVKTGKNMTNRIAPVKRPVQSDVDPLKTALTELLKGPAKNEQESGLFTEIPEKTELLGIVSSKEKAVINLSKDFESGGGSESMTLRLEQFSNTALDAAGGKPVYLEINGKKVNSVGGEGVEVSRPLSRT